MLTDNQFKLIKSYINKLKWLSEHIEQFIEYKGIWIHPKLLEINKVTGKCFADEWIKLNAEVSKQALASPVFDSYLNVMLNKYDDERKEKIKKARL